MTKPQAGILVIAALLIGLHSRAAAQQSTATVITAAPQTITPGAHVTLSATVSANDSAANSPQTITLASH